MKRFERVFAFLAAMLMVAGATIPALGAIDRHSGADRYATAVEISRTGWEDGADVVVLARGDLFADALAGVPLAYANGAPILLTKPNQLPANIKDEIVRLGAKKVFILGGTAAISQSVEDELTEMGLEVVRIKGADRYGTAAAIAAIVAPDGAATVFLAFGGNFPDALAAASYAALSGSPILLTLTNEIPDETLAALEALDPDEVIVVGGTAAIGEGVTGQLGHFLRIFGADRYETALALAQRYASEQDFMFIASGTDASGGADALTGAALAAARGTGVLLVGNTLPPGVANFLGSHVQDAHIFGGNAAVAASVASAIEEALFAPGGDTPLPPGPGTVAVKEIIVAGQDGERTVELGETLQLSATVQPNNATNKTVDWSVENITGAATIDGSGLLTTTGVGVVNVKATARDGSGVVGSLEIVIGNIIISNVTELAEAIANQQDGEFWVIKPGTYDLSQDELAKFEDKKFDENGLVTSGGQGSWYFPIHANGLTIMGVDKPLITSSVMTPNGNWATQNFVTVWGANVTLVGITLKGKSEPNKLIEVLGKDFTLQDFESLPYEDFDDAGVVGDFSGSLLFNNKTDLGTVTLKNVKIQAHISFSYNSGDGKIVFDGVEIDQKDGLMPRYGWSLLSPNSTGELTFECVGDGLTILLDSAVNESTTATNSLVETLKNVPSGSKIVLEAGTYYVPKELVIPAGVTLDVDTNGASIIVTQHVVDKNYSGTPGGIFGGINRYASIQAAIDGANSRDYICIAPGEYEVNKQLTINKEITLVGLGTETKIKAQMTAALVTVSCNGVVLKNLTLQGGSGDTKGAGVKIASKVALDGLTIEDCVIEGFTNGIYADTNQTDKPVVSNVVIKGCTFRDNTLKGIYVEKLSESAITDCHFISNGAGHKAGAGIDINAKYALYENIQVSNCVFTDNGNGTEYGGAILVKARGTGLDTAYSTAPATLTGVVITDCTFNGNAKAVVLGEYEMENTGPEVQIINPTYNGNTEDLVDYRNTSE